MGALIVAAIGLVIGVTTTIVGYVDRANKAAENEKAAADAAAIQQDALDLNTLQHETAAGQTILQADRQARAADAMARVSAGESGVAGASVDALLDSMARERWEHNLSVSRNVDAQREQNALGGAGILANRDNRIASVGTPNPWVLGLQIGGHGLDAANTYYSNQPSTGANSGG